jgi:hypothetical protein
LGFPVISTKDLLANMKQSMHMCLHTQWGLWGPSLTMVQQLSALLLQHLLLKQSWTPSHQCLMTSLEQIGMLYTKADSWVCTLPGKLSILFLVSTLIHCLTGTSQHRKLSMLDVPPMTNSHQRRWLQWHGCMLRRNQARSKFLVES